MKQKILMLLSFLCIVCLSGCTLKNYSEESIAEIQNPASTYCIENGGELEIIPDDGGERGKCNFKDGSFYEERAYYHGECSQGRGDGNTIETGEIENNNEIDPETKQEISEMIEEIENENITTCTADVKKCDDGTYVSRGGPNCEFAECPGIAISEVEIQDTLKEYENTGSELTETDIELMNEIINTILQE